MRKSLLFLLLALPVGAQQRVEVVATSEPLPVVIDTVSITAAITASTPSIKTYPYQKYASDDGTYFRVDIGTVMAKIADIDTNLFLIVNLSTNTKRMKFDWIEYVNYDQADAVIIRWYLNPVISSSGTAVAVRPGNLASNSTSQMLTFRSPVTTSRGSNIPVQSLVGPENKTREEYNLALQLGPGQVILVTANPQTANIPIGLRLNWLEE